MMHSFVKFTVFYLVTNNIVDVNSMHLKIRNSNLQRLKREQILDEGALVVCEPIPEPKPDFNVPGQRISEQKCEEYKWIIKSWEQRRNTITALENCPPGYVHQLNRDDDGIAAGEDPNLVAVGWEDKDGWKTRCGGSLISSKFIMASAHCFPKTKRLNKPVVIRIGDKNILDKANIIEAKIKREILHPDFTPNVKYNDLALIELEEEITFNKNVLPACLWKEVDVSSLGKFANTTGWSQVKSDEVDKTPKPKKASVKIIEKETCEELLVPVCGDKCSIKDTQICAENFFTALAKTGQWKEGNHCWGYSGAPLQIRISSSSEGALNYVVGLSSYGARCASETVPDVYTRISSYLDWIESVVWPQN